MELIEELHLVHNTELGLGKTGRNNDQNPKHKYLKMPDSDRQSSIQTKIESPLTKN